MFGAAGSVLLAEWRVGLIGVSYTAQGAVRIHGYGLQISFVGHIKEVKLAERQGSDIARFWEEEEGEEEFEQELLATSSGTVAAIVAALAAREAAAYS